MKKKIKIPAEVLEQLEEQHPQMADAVKRQMDAEGRIEILDEVWNRQDGEEAKDGRTEPSLPECIETGLTIGDLFRGWKGKE